MGRTYGPKTVFALAAEKAVPFGQTAHDRVRKYMDDLHTPFVEIVRHNIEAIIFYKSCNMQSNCKMSHIVAITLRIILSIVWTYSRVSRDHEE